MMVNLARYEFVANPAAALSLICRGVPEQHQLFWNDLGVDGLFTLYRAQSVSSVMVLKMLPDTEGSDPKQERVFVYLRQYIGNECG